MSIHIKSDDRYLETTGIHINYSAREQLAKSVYVFDKDKWVQVFGVHPKVISEAIVGSGKDLLLEDLEILDDGSVMFVNNAVNNSVTPNVLRYPRYTYKDGTLNPLGPPVATARVYNYFAIRHMPTYQSDAGICCLSAQGYLNLYYGSNFNTSTYRALPLYTDLIETDSYTSKFLTFPQRITEIGEGVLLMLPFYNTGALINGSQRGMMVYYAYHAEYDADISSSIHYKKVDGYHFAHKNMGYGYDDYSYVLSSPDKTFAMVYLRHTNAPLYPPADGSGGYINQVISIVDNEPVIVSELYQSIYNPVFISDNGYIYCMQQNGGGAMKVYNHNLELVEEYTLKGSYQRHNEPVISKPRRTAFAYKQGFIINPLFYVDTTNKRMTEMPCDLEVETNHTTYSVYREDINKGYIVKFPNNLTDEGDRPTHIIEYSIGE